MVIRIARGNLEGIRAHANAAYPEECCGLLIALPGTRDVVDSVKMRNAFSGPRGDRYHIDPLELFRVDREAARRGLAIAGVYHSHPDHPATLSQFDLEHAFPWYFYVVVSVLNGEASETRSWLPDPDRRTVSEEPMEVREGEPETLGASQPA